MKKFKFTTGIPPLVLIGTIIVLFPIFTFMTIDRINKQKAQSIKLLIEKSTALIRSFEAGTYSGMMNMQWSRAAMENLLTETAALPDITYLFIVDKSGDILVHSQKEEIGSTYGQGLNLQQVIQKDKIGWRIITDQNQKDVFEVHKRFAPKNQRRLKNSNAMMPMMHGGIHSNAFQHVDSYKDTVIFVGLDMESITIADKNDTRHAIMMGGILALIGLTGFILVFIVQRYSQTRSSLSRMQVFSDNLVENMPVGLIATDMNNQIISINPEAASILDLNLGFDSKEMESNLPREILNLLDDINGQKNTIDKEITLKGGKKTEIILESIASSLYSNDGESLGSLLILRDKTELYHLRDEIERSQRLAAIGSLAAGVAHEIRNPLSSLKGYATFFKEIFDRDSENFSIAETMIKEVDRLDRVVGELGQLAKPISVSGDRVDIETLAVEIAQMVEFEPDAERIEIKTDIEPHLPQIDADADRLKQMLLNLCLNSLQAMKNSGMLTIRVQKSTLDENIIIKISDTGCGITEKDLKQIFDPYFTTKLSGTGLGLSIVHNIIKAHKGKISVESKPGKGTIFTVSLPIRIS